MTEIVTTSIVGLFCTLVSSGATFFLTRRKYNSEVKSQEIVNVMNAFEGYKKITEEALKKQADEIAKLKAEIDRLKEENHQNVMRTLAEAAEALAKTRKVKK
jgi:uncharacterized protein YukE